MEYIKDRNLIKAYMNSEYMGAWDILSGEFIGKKGRPVRNIPSAFAYQNLCARSYSTTINPSHILSYLVRFYRDNMLEYTPARASRLECLASLRLIPGSIYDLDDTTKLSKDLVQYLVKNNRSCYDRDTVQEYVFSTTYAHLLKDRPEWYKKVFQTLHSTYPIEYLKTMLNRLNMEHVEILFKERTWSIAGNMETIVRKYYDCCMEMYGEVKVTPNIYSNYINVLYLNEQYRQEHYDEHLNYTNNKPYLYFSTDTFQVAPLLTREQFHKEATYQSNCVERLYMDKVHDGNTHVVAVRKVNDPDTPFITCEVDNNGKIIQYLGRCNCMVVDSEAIIFRRMYQEHLRMSINGIKEQ